MGPDFRRSNFLFVTWWGGGNVTPVAALARQLVRAGHAVDVLGPDMVEPSFAGTGATFIRQRAGAAWTPDGPTQLASELLSTVEVRDHDAVVVDFMQPEALSALEKSERRYAAFVHTLPQPVLDRKSTNMGAFLPLARLNELRHALGLDAVGDVHDLLDRAHALFGATARALDRATTDTHLDLAHLGPLVDEPGDDTAWEPPPGDGPVVVVSLGTTPMGEEKPLARVIEALATLRVRASVTVGDHVDIDTMPSHSNVRVSRFVRHSAMLREADLFINHAGLGSVTAGATFGVPQLCIPLGRDQPDNASRVVELGIGRSLPADSGADEIHRAIESVLADDDITDVSRALAARIAADHPPDAPVQLLSAFASPATP